MYLYNIHTFFIRKDMVHIQCSSYSPYLSTCPKKVFAFLMDIDLLGSDSCVFQHITKGQLISKCPFGFIVWTKLPTKLFLNFCLEIFCSFLGASWKLFGLPGDLVCNIINKEACRKPQKASRKPPGRYKKFQGRNSEIISLVILSKR